MNTERNLTKTQGSSNQWNPSFQKRISRYFLSPALRINERIKNSFFLRFTVWFSSRICLDSAIPSSCTHSSGKKTACSHCFLESGKKNWPYNEIAGVDEPAVLGALQVPRVPHHGAGPAALRAGIHVEHLIGDDLEQLLHHHAEVGRLPLRLQPLVTEQRRALRGGCGSGDTFDKGSDGSERTSGGRLSFLASFSRLWNEVEQDGVYCSI